MTPLAKLWTWTGHAFILLAIGWVVFVRGGISDKIVPEGVAISRAYWGLLVTLIAGCSLAWTSALYVRAAKRDNAQILVPPNMKFDEISDRSLIISWGTACVFTTAILTTLTIFAVRYGDSAVHSWNAKSPIEAGFLASRLRAHQEGCSHQPCFAIGSQFDAVGKPISGVNEYILYITDGGLCVLGAALAAALVFLVVSATTNTLPITNNQETEP